MHVRIFTGSKLHEVMANVRQGLGPDAVILDCEHIRNRDGSEIWQLFAAIDNDPDANIERNEW